MATATGLAINIKFDSKKTVFHLAPSAKVKYAIAKSAAFFEVDVKDRNDLVLIHQGTKLPEESTIQVSLELPRTNTSVYGSAVMFYVLECNWDIYTHSFERTKRKRRVCCIFLGGKGALANVCPSQSVCITQFRPHLVKSKLTSVSRRIHNC